jgi:PAS domain S-box-containing protein
MKKHGLPLLPNGRIDEHKEESINVLCVDDESGFLESTKQLLELEASFHVDTASSVKDALEKMESKVFDVIVSDYQMPRKSGLDFLKELRDSGNDVPFILFTGKGREEVAVEALNLGADRYFNKFGNPETVYGELVHGIRQAVAQRRVEKEIWDREERLRAILASSPDAMIITDMHGIITDCNLETLKLLEASSMSDIIGKHSRTLATKETQDTLGIAFKKLTENGLIAYQETKFLSKSGSEVPVGFSASILRDAYGKPVGAVALARNISDRKKVEAKLRQSESKFRSFFENSPDYCYIISPEGKILEINKSALEALGYSKKELLGKSFLTAIYSPFSRKKARKLIANWKLTGKIQNEDLEIVTKQGEKRTVLLSGHSVCDVDGRLLHYVVVQKDVTERKKADEELRKSEEKYRSIVELSPTGIISLDMNGVITSVNRAILDQTGFSEKEFLGKHFTQLTGIPSENLSELTKKINSFLREETPDVFEFVYCCKDGTRLLAEASVGLLTQNGEPSGFQMILRDITERKQSDAELRENEKRFRELSELLPEVIFETDEKGTLTFVNHEAYTRFGYSREEFEAGLHAHQMIAPEDRDQARETMRRVMSGEKTGSNEYTALKKDGTTFPIIVNSTPIRRGNKIVGIRGLMVDITERKKVEEILTKERKTLEKVTGNMNATLIMLSKDYRILWANKYLKNILGDITGKLCYSALNQLDHVCPGCKLKEVAKTGKQAVQERLLHDYAHGDLIFEISAIPIKDEKGNVAEILELGIDITERKKAENELKNTLKQMETPNEKLSVIGKLTRHDTRNKLAVIANNAYLAKTLLNKDHVALESLNSIESSINQIEKILEFSRIYEMLGTEELSYIDVNGSFEEAVLLLSCPENIKLVTGCEDLKVRADSSLRQIFYNLIDNSMKHGETVSRIKVHCRERKTHLKLVYEDNGIGIPEDEKERIFAEGYGKGTGYGLYLIKKICESYGWSINEKGVPGKGAKFVMTIPKLDKNGKPNYTLNTE